MAEKERKLTKAETERIKNFEVLSKRLESEGYQVTKCEISSSKINAYMFVIFIPFGVIYWLLYRLFGNLDTDVQLLINLAQTGSSLIVRVCIYSGIYLVLMVFLVIIHEALHGITWALFCQNRFKSIQFGIIWKYLTAYCTCLEPLGFGAYLTGAVMPLIVLGFGFLAAAIATGSIFWFLFAFIATLGAGGDIAIILMLFRHRRALLLDHPTEPGFYAFEKTSSQG